MVAGANLVLKVFADICRRHRGRTAACERRPDSWHGTGGAGGRRRACVRWAGRARAYTQRRVHGLWHHLRAFGWRAGVQHARSRARICILRPDSARYHTRIKRELSRLHYCIHFSARSQSRYTFRGSVRLYSNSAHIYASRHGVSPHRTLSGQVVCLFVFVCVCVCVLSSRCLVCRTSHLCVCRVGTPPAR